MAKSWAGLGRVSSALSTALGLDKLLLWVHVSKGTKSLAPSAPTPKGSVASEPRLGVAALDGVSPQRRRTFMAARGGSGSARLPLQAGSGCSFRVIHTLVTDEPPCFRGRHRRRRTGAPIDSPRNGNLLLLDDPLHFLPSVPLEVTTIVL